MTPNLLEEEATKTSEEDDIKDMDLDSSSFRTKVPLHDHIM